MTAIDIEYITFQSPARIGAATVSGASNSIAGGAPCAIKFDAESGLVFITHLPSKKETIVPLANVGSMVPVAKAKK